MLCYRCLVWLLDENYAYNTYEVLYEKDAEHFSVKKIELLNTKTRFEASTAYGPLLSIADLTLP
jgi:hypothetical protein